MIKSFRESSIFDVQSSDMFDKNVLAEIEEWGKIVVCKEVRK